MSKKDGSGSSDAYSGTLEGIHEKDVENSYEGNTGALQVKAYGMGLEGGSLSARSGNGTDAEGFVIHGSPSLSREQQLIMPGSGFEIVPLHEADGPGVAAPAEHSNPSMTLDERLSSGVDARKRRISQAH